MVRIIAASLILIAALALPGASVAQDSGLGAYEEGLPGNGPGGSGNPGGPGGSGNPGSSGGSGDPGGLAGSGDPGGSIGSDGSGASGGGSAVGSDGGRAGAGGSAGAGGAGEGGRHAGQNRRGTLPNTGSETGVLAALGLAMIGLGCALRRKARTI